MPIDWGVILPLFVLLLLIGCFLAYVWYYKKFPRDPNEGFQVTSTTNLNSAVLSNATYQTIYGNITKLQGSSTIWGSSLGSQSRLGGATSIIWPTTPLDKSYDAYWESEILAQNARMKSMPPILPPEPTSTVGLSFADFDPLNPTIAWDQDNVSSFPDPSTCTWGKIHPEASKSIFLKNYIMNLIEAPPPPNCDPNSLPYCYASPMLGIQTTNAGWGNFIQYGVEGVGTALADAVVTDPDTLKAVGRGAIKVASMVVKPIAIVAGKIGQHLAKALGEKIVKQALLKASGKVALLVKEIGVIKLALRTALGPIYRLLTLPAEICGWTSAAADKAVAAIPVVNVVTSATGIAICSSLYAVANSGLFTVQCLMIILLIAQTIVPIFVSSAYKTGGVCPSGYQELHEYIGGQLQSILGMFLPGFGLLEGVFQTYLCFKKYTWEMVLKEPPRTPAFMVDRTLSVTYHADWMVSHNSQSPEPSLYYTMVDPPPPCYTTFAKSDLATIKNTSDIAKWAREIIPTGVVSTTTGSDGSSLSNPLAQLLYVQKCPLGTTPSVDGRFCEKTVYQITPIQPTLIECPAGQEDDGTNCITTAGTSTNCSGGIITYIPSSIWDPNYGYNKITQTPYICNGVVQPIRGTPYKDRMRCPVGYEHNGIDELLCYPKCTQPPTNTPDTCNPTPFSYKRVGATCVSSVNTMNRQMMYATAKNYQQNQRYDPILTLDKIKFPYCDFSSPVMLDRMAQFYYDKSFTHPSTSIDSSGNTMVSVQYITKFYSVIASSELSCDVICEILFVSFDLVTGGNYSSTRGCAASYSTDKTGWKGCPFCFRRFYFVRDPEDPQGIFTVTACTITDYTASSAMVHSTDFYINIPVGLSPLSHGKVDLMGKPATKTWVENHRNASIVDPAAFARSSLQTGLNVTFGLGGFMAMMLGQQLIVEYAKKAGAGAGASTVAGIFFMTAFGAAQSFAEIALNKCRIYNIPPNQITSQNGQFIVGNGGSMYTVMSNNDWWTVDQGPIYELSEGYEPTIEWCRTSYVSNQHCAYKYVIRDMVNYYHLVSPLKHIKQITSIEPRGLKPVSQGCYYKWKEVDYDPVTNLESDILVDKEIIIPVTIKDYSTCAYTFVKNGTNSFNTNVADPNFAVRSFIDPDTKNTVYPTRRKIYTSDLLARFVRIRPSLLSGDGLINISEIKVYDTSGNLVSFNKNVYATSTKTGSLPPKSVVDGKIHAATKLEHVWQANTAVRAGAADNEYLDIDLKDMVAISHVEYYGSSIPLNLNGDEAWPTNAQALVTAARAAVTAATIARQAAALAASRANTSHPVTSWLDNLKKSIEDAANDVVDDAVDKLETTFATNSFTAINNNTHRSLPPPPFQLISNTVAAASAESIAYDAEKAAIAAASVYRNYGVRIQFLYNNTPNETPIFEYSLPTDDPIQIVNVYSSVTNVPACPLSGPVIIPRPVSTAKYLGAPDCPYKCEDKPIIDSLVQQYNTIHPESKIISVLNGTTGSTGTTGTAPSCEYLVELVGTDESGGWAGSIDENGGWKGSRGIKLTAQSITREYMTMTLQSNIVRPPKNVFGRFVVVTPSFIEGTVLEISKLLVYTYDRTACGSSCDTPTLNCSCIQYKNNARSQAVAFFNGILSLAYNPISAQSVVDGTATPQSYLNTNLAPPLFIAADNDPSTFFQVDLGQNMEIYQIVFVGRSDLDRVPGGIVGTKIQVFRDQPSNQLHATDGTYPPVFSQSLLTDKCTQTINVVAVPQCNFTLMSANKMVKPVFIQEDLPGFSAPDTSGGVFTFNSIIGSLRSFWNSILPNSATAPLVPATEDITQSGRLLGNIRDTISMSNTILGTTNKCSDPAMLQQMMTAYNILRSPSPTKQFTVEKKTMIQILKAGPSSPNSCDLLFQESYEQYADYIIDAPANAKGTVINAARFIFTKDGGSGSGSTNSISVSPDSSRIYDISSNAIGIISDATIVNPIFRGPAQAVDCRSPAVVSAVMNTIKLADTKGSIYTTIIQTFQSSPLSCEYNILKDLSDQTDTETYVRAIFTLPNKLVSATEFFPEDITMTENPVTRTKIYSFFSAPTTPIILPNLFTYDATRPSSRVNNEEILLTPI